MNSVTQIFGKRIKKLRSERNMTQEQLAEKADISVSFLGGIERGVKSPTIETVQKLAVALELTITQLMTFDTGAEAEEDEKLNSLISDFAEQIKRMYNKTASPYAYGDRFRIVTRPREVYFPFGGTYNLFTL